VRRPTGPWSPAVHEYLRHLASAGFEGSPRVLATGDGWEELTYSEGEVAADPYWEPGRGTRLPPQARTDRALAGAGRLLRALHEAAAGFEPAVTAYRFHPHPPRAGEVVSHGDLGPWNTVYREGFPVAFIDWDGAGPVEPLADLADAARAFVPLAPPGRRTTWSSWPGSCAGSTASRPAWPARCDARLAARSVEPEAALLDEQAAVFHVEQSGVLGDGPGLGRGDAQL
jgi:Ser/Thr protein kinase RdoA (MazF antagonist)